MTSTHASTHASTRPLHTLRHLAAAVAALACLGTAQAATNFTKATYDGAKADIQASYKTEKDACSSLAGNTKDICVEQAKAHEKVSMARLESNYSGTPKDALKLQQAVYESRYDVAKEKCDDLSGNAKDVCVRDAKTQRDKAEADVKLKKVVTEAVLDDASTRMKADYKLASEKCEALSGGAKDVCVASAKARFNERW